MNFWELWNYLYLNCTGRYMAMHIKIVHQKHKSYCMEKSFLYCLQFLSFHSLLLNLLVKFLPPPLPNLHLPKPPMFSMLLNQVQTFLNFNLLLKLPRLVNSSLYSFDIYSHSFQDTSHFWLFSNFFLVASQSSLPIPHLPIL